MKFHLSRMAAFTESLLFSYNVKPFEKPATIRKQDATSLPLLSCKRTEGSDSSQKYYYFLFDLAFRANLLQDEVSASISRVQLALCWQLGPWSA